MNDKNICCPMCQGKGKIILKQAHIKYTPAQRNKARKLFAEGYSLRQIGKKLKIEGGPQKIKSMMLSKLIL